jgi:prepilin-type N-terminal cleavage/methylation domain-containing protein
MAANMRHTRQAGFTLVEILIALSLATALTLTMFAAITPWINMKHKIDTEHRMGELKDAVATAYRNYAMQVDSQTSTSAVLAIGADPTNPINSTTVTVSTSQQAGGSPLNTCGPNAQANMLLTPYLVDSPAHGIQDGYSQNICIFISDALAQTIEGVTLYYRVIALVSSGQDGRLDAGTGFKADTGVLTLAADGDDVGVLVSGFPIEYALYKETKTRLDRVAEMYSSFFTARFQGNVARDYSIDYFTQCPTALTGTPACAAYDTVGTDTPPPILPTATDGVWASVGNVLAPALGLGPEEQNSAWEINSNFEVANTALTNAADQIFKVQVQTPTLKSVNLPPYTALLRAQIPTPVDVGTSYALKVVSGTY